MSGVFPLHIPEIFLILLTRQGACFRRLFRINSAPVCSILRIWIGRMDCTFKLFFNSAKDQTVSLFTGSSHITRHLKAA